MAFPISVTYTFGPMTGTIPLSDLDSNFSTLVTSLNNVSSGTLALDTPALGTPASGTLTNCTGLPVVGGGTGLSSLTANYIPYGNGTGAYQSSSQFQYNGTYLLIGAGSALGGTTNPVLAVTGNPATTNYIQSYVYNSKVGVSSSADFVAYADNSTDAHGWADMGFTSSTYADSVYTVTGANEAYIFGSALNSSYTGNLVYATDSTGSANAHQWYVGGFTQAKGAWKMQLTSTGLQLANALGTAYGGTGQSTYTNGQLLIGNTTGNTLTKATLTASGPITVTNGAGSITLGTATSAGQTANTTITNTATFTTGGVTLASQTAAAGAVWRVKAFGQFTAASSATARTAQVACFWGSTQLVAITPSVLISTAQTTQWQVEFTLTASSTTAIWTAGTMMGRTASATALAIDNATPASTTVTSGAQTLDLRFRVSTAVAAESWIVQSVTMERIV